jgi:antimicrobial peptide system SdpA family protein
MSREPRLPRIAAAWFIFVVGLTSIVGVYALHAALPRSPIDLPFQNVARTALFLPEGWAFFTRNPREERTLAFLRSANGSWEAARPDRLSDPRNLFGLSRAPRSQALEMGLLVTQLAVGEWKSCDGSREECFEAAPVARELENPTPRPMLCGTVGFVAQPPLPWAWWRSPKGKDVRMPMRVTKVSVRC